MDNYQVGDMFYLEGSKEQLFTINKILDFSIYNEPYYSVSRKYLNRRGYIEKLDLLGCTIDDCLVKINREELFVGGG